MDKYICGNGQCRFAAQKPRPVLKQTMYDEDRRNWTVGSVTTHVTDWPLYPIPENHTTPHLSWTSPQGRGHRDTRHWDRWFICWCRPRYRQTVTIQHTVLWSTWSQQLQSARYS